MAPLFNYQNFLFCFISAILFLTIEISCERHYSGYKVISVKKAENKTQYDALVELQKRPGLDFWSDPSMMRSTDIMVAPLELKEVENYLKTHGLVYDVAMRDVQGMVEKDMKQRENRQGGMNWKQYHRLEVIYAWLESQAHQNPRLVRVSNLGKSSEGRPIKMAKIATNSYHRNPVILIDAGIHAREWIAPATATYMMKQLLSVPLEDRDLIDSLDWFFIPVLNPDGYEYTHTEDRLWRKTRSTHNGDDCIGVDANRNFDFHWGEAGTKENPCANTYPGPYAFSEPEANATAGFLWNNRGKIKAYLTLHSYSQLFLTPYGYTEDLPDDYDDMHELGVKAAKALENVHGTEYEVGAPSHILYLYSGSSQDWAREYAQVKYAYTIELRDQGNNKFLLPEEEIEGSGQEMWEAVKVVARRVIQEFSKKSGGAGEGGKIRGNKTSPHPSPFQNVIDTRTEDKYTKVKPNSSTKIKSTTKTNEEESVTKEEADGNEEDEDEDESDQDDDEFDFDDEPPNHDYYENYKDAK